MKKKIIALNVNGEAYETAIYPHATLLEVLREDLGLTGSKESCGLGACGACTVMINGEAVLSCLTLAASVEGKEILTVEGLTEGQALSPLQGAFLEHGAVQCGFCTPGMLMSATAVLSEHPRPDEQEIRKAISGNICRCTGYVQIVEAIKAIS